MPYCLCVAILAAGGAVFMPMAARSQPPASGHKQSADIELFPMDKIKWQDGPASLPKGACIAVLEGNPTKEGPFVFRLKLPDRYRVPPHTHPKTERVTVISPAASSRITFWRPSLFTRRPIWSLCGRFPPRRPVGAPSWTTSRPNAPAIAEEIFSAQARSRSSIVRLPPPS